MARILGIIPARAGSKGIPGKNLKNLAGKPLLAYTAEAAKAAGVIDRLVLSTDSAAIANLGRGLGLEVPFMRPDYLAADDSPMLGVLQHAVTEMDGLGWIADIIVLLQPTSPLRRPKHIQDAIALLRREDCDSVVSVVRIPKVYSPQKSLLLEGRFLRFYDPSGGGITRRQQLKEAFAREGTIYVLWREVLMEKGSLYGNKCLPLIVTHEEGLSLDDMDDWRKAESILSANGSRVLE